MALPNDAHALVKGELFPEALIPEFFNKVKGHSSLAKMSGSSPIPFNGLKEFTFTMDNDVDIVAEAGAKSVGGAQAGAITIIPIKIEYGARVSDEFLYASEEVRLDMLRAFSEGWAAKVARGLDLMAMHGINPRTGSSSLVIGDNNFDTAITNVVEYLADSTTADQNIEAATAMVIAGEHDVTGVIVGDTIRAALATAVTTGGAKAYPELAWGAKPESLNGLKFDVNGTVEANSADARAYVGDFAGAFKWGIAKQLPIEIIRYGNPDNDATAGDLAGHNQVYIRGEAYIGWGILDASAFAAVAVDSDDT